MVRQVQTTRRAAVGTLLSVGAGFWTGSFSSGSQKNSISDKLNVAIVGAGRGSVGGIANLPAMSNENVAMRVNQKLVWDGIQMSAKNCPEADACIRPDYRKGWVLL
ncbi:MAG: hypothetical protein VX435_07395 [Planctomycetota bacterium]|nr:hypothetical protein [Planctomycetota bacterium]